MYRETRKFKAGLYKGKTPLEVFVEYEDYEYLLQVHFRSGNGIFIPRVVLDKIYNLKKST
jgi:hypothetical protein